MQAAEILSNDQYSKIIDRLAHQIVEPYDDVASLALVGMQRRGVFLAKMLQKRITHFYAYELPLGVLDVTFYRDDFRTKLKMPTVQVTEIPFDLTEKHVILVDDVLYTGRTIRAAMDALMSFGRPASIKACCLIDRGHRELPIQADYTGMYVPTYRNEEIHVEVEGLDGSNRVMVVDKESKIT